MDNKINDKKTDDNNKALKILSNLDYEKLAAYMGKTLRSADCQCPNGGALQYGAEMKKASRSLDCICPNGGALQYPSNS